jgi:predicted HTH domain antitoxin
MAAGTTPQPGNDELATAVGQYVLGEISLGKAAETVDMTRWEFEELLEDAGFTALYGPRSSDDLQDEVDAAFDLEGNCC